MFLSQSPDPVQNPKVLIVDDEAAIRLVLGTRLKLLNYDVCSASDGQEALEQFQQCNPDLVILDLMLPKLNGLAVCKEMKKSRQTPVIILSAVADLNTRIQGLESGADDFIVKPFSPSEVEARIKAILRRQRQPGACEQSGSDEKRKARFGDLNIDFAKRQVVLASRRVRLTGMEFNLLQFLAKNSGQAFSRNEIFERVWQLSCKSTHDLRVVDVHISRLRHKIERDCREPEFIHTARGIGYMFDCCT